MLIDISNWQHPFDAAAAKTDGVTQVIVGCQRPTLANSMIEGCRAAGINVIGVYAFLYWGTDTMGQTLSAIAVAKNYGIGTVWLDCEDSDDASKNATPQTRILELSACITAVENAGMKASIYAGGPFWRAAMANTTRFKHLPLWYPNYGTNDATLEPIKAVDFGGWTAVAIHQFTSEYLLPTAGIRVDANYNFMEADEVTREEHDAILARIAQLEVQAWGESGVPRTNEKGYAPMNMYELATGRTYQANAQGVAGPRKVTLAGTLTEE